MNLAATLVCVFVPPVVFAMGLPLVYWFYRRCYDTTDGALSTAFVWWLAGSLANSIGELIMLSVLPSLM